MEAERAKKRQSKAGEEHGRGKLVEIVPQAINEKENQQDNENSSKENSDTEKGKTRDKIGAKVGVSGKLIGGPMVSIPMVIVKRWWSRRIGMGQPTKLAALLLPCAVLLKCCDVVTMSLLTTIAKSPACPAMKPTGCLIGASRRLRKLGACLPSRPLAKRSKRLSHGWRKAGRKAS